MTKTNNLNNIQNLKERGELLIIPKLESLSSHIHAEKSDLIGYCSVHRTYNDSLYSRLISIATKSTWIRNEYIDINEVVLDVYIQLVGDKYIVFDADISFGDGTIIRSVQTIKIPFEVDISLNEFTSLYEASVNEIFQDGYKYIAEAIDTITLNHYNTSK